MGASGFTFPVGSLPDNAGRVNSEVIFIDIDRLGLSLELEISKFSFFQAHSDMASSSTQNEEKRKKGTLPDFRECPFLLFSQPLASEVFSSDQGAEEERGGQPSLYLSPGRGEHSLPSPLGRGIG